MILRTLRKHIALAWAEWRYRGKPATLATVRRSIGGRYRRSNARKARRITVIAPDGTSYTQSLDAEHERKVRAVEKIMGGEK
jgi:hypothetical protein